MTRTLGNTLIVSFLLMTCIPSLAATAEASNNVSGEVKVRIWDRAQVGSEAWNHAKAVAEGIFRTGRNPIDLVALCC